MYTVSIPENADIFKVVKEIPIMDIARGHLSRDFQKKGGRYIGPCPFHQEKNGSCTFFPDTNSFYCFGCGAGGDGVDFVAQLHGLRPIEAARMIARDFGIQVHTPEPAELQRIRKQRERERQALAAFEARRDEAHRRLLAMYRIVTGTLNASGWDGWQQYSEFVHQLDGWLNIIEGLESRDIETQINALLAAREVV